MTSEVKGQHLTQVVMPRDLALGDVNGRRMIIRGDEHKAIGLKRVYYQLDPVSFTAGAFTNNPITFRLAPNSCSQIDNAYLELTCIESGGLASVTPVVAPFLIDRIDVGLNGTVNPLQSLPAEWLYLMNQFITAEEVASFLALNSQNMTATAYAGESAIAASGTAVYLIPLLGSLFTLLNPQTYNADVIIQVYPRAAPVSAGTGTLQLSNARLRIHTRKDDLVDNYSARLHGMYDRLISYTNFFITTHSQTLTAGTQTEIALQGVQSTVGAMCVMLRASKSVTASAIRVFSALGGTSEFNGAIDLVDYSKITLMGSGAVSPQLTRLSTAWTTRGDFSSKVAVYWLIFSEDPSSTAVRGKHTGAVAMDGRQFLRLTPGTGFTSQTYIVDVLYLGHAALSLSKGRYTRIH